MDGVLCDREIKLSGTELIEPFDLTAVQPSSYDLSLDSLFLIPKPGVKIDLRMDEPSEHMSRLDIEGGEMVLCPGQCVLGSTIEVVKCPLHLTARVEGKSSIGRIFLAVHVTAGVIDAGWDGQITLEIVNHGNWDIVLWRGMKIAQVSYFPLSGLCDVPYGSSSLGSHYLGQRGPTAASGKRHQQKQGK
jgi:dCTP deaminase